MKRWQSTLETALIPTVAVLLGLVVGGLFITMAGLSPFETYQRLACEGFGADGCTTFGDLFVIEVTDAETGATQSVFAPFYGSRGHSLALALEQATPLILTALAATVAFKAGMFSIGMDGQFALGAVVAVFIGYWLPPQIYTLFGVSDVTGMGVVGETLMRIIIPTLAIAAAMITGAFYSWIAGILKVKLNVNELICTIILNAIAVQFVGFLLNGPMRSDMNNIARTPRIDDVAWLMPFNRGIFAEVEWFNGSRLGVGIVLALLAGVLLWFFVWRMTAGYEQRMTRGAQPFARFGGVSTGRAILRAMLISGALSGLAGSIQILGVERRMVDGFVNSGIGFDGVLIAILARESIMGIFAVALLYSGLQIGAINLQFGNIPRQLGGIIIALIILFTSMESFFREIITRTRIRMVALSQRRTAPSGGD